MRAGFIPYYFKNAEPYFMFMIPSNSYFGGTRANIAKGHIDYGESRSQAAIREAYEELGLKRSNLKPETIRHIWTGEFDGSRETYKMIIFGGEIIDINDFAPFGHETAKTIWLSRNEFELEGRKSHLPIVNVAYNVLYNLSQ